MGDRRIGARLGRPGIGLPGSDPHHTRETSERVAALLPNARLVEPPWNDEEWNERRAAATEGLFVRWPRLVPQLLEWSAGL